MENRRRPSSNFAGKTNQENLERRSNESNPNVLNNRQSISNINQKNDRFNRDNNEFPLHNPAKHKANSSNFQQNKASHTKGKSSPRAKFQKPLLNQVKPKIISDLQITDGKHLGKYLQTSASPKMRQTPRSLRESLFKVLFRKVSGGRFLDLCAGIGTIGIEAISRGAVVSTFVDRSAKMNTLIKKNLEAFQIKEKHGEAFEMEAVPFLKQMGKRNRRWDVIYFDPGFSANFEEVLKYFERGIGIEKFGVLIIEHHSEMIFPENLGLLKRLRVVTISENSLSFYEKN